MGCKWGMFGDKDREVEIDEDGVRRRTNVLNLQMFMKGKRKSHVWCPPCMKVR